MIIPRAGSCIRPFSSGTPEHSFILSSCNISSSLPPPLPAAAFPPALRRCPQAARYMLTRWMLHDYAKQKDILKAVSRSGRTFELVQVHNPMTAAQGALSELRSRTGRKALIVIVHDECSAT
jgi:hypothetical protein